MVAGSAVKVFYMNCMGKKGEFCFLGRVSYASQNYRRRSLISFQASYSGDKNVYSKNAVGKKKFIFMFRLQVIKKGCSKLSSLF